MRFGILTLIITIIQTITAFAILFLFYMIFALLDNTGGIDGLLGLAFIQPILGIIFSGLTVLVCLFIGLPFRIYEPFQKLFSKGFFITFGLALTGITLLIFCTIPAYQETTTISEDGIPFTKKVPNTFMFFIGWFMTAFFILHTFPPRLLMDKIDHVINSLRPARQE